MSNWVQAEIEFAACYSYRVPDLSPSFAVCCPVPSPAAIRLALVDAVIQHTGSVGQGRALFELVKTARLEIQPPPRVAVVKFFLKRLKRDKQHKTAPTVVSTGMREYCFPAGPLVVWMEAEESSRVAEAFRWLRRLGTTDSLASCTTAQGNPDVASCVRLVNGGSPVAELSGRPVFTLHELKPQSTFDQVNPFSRPRRGQPFEKRLYVLPMVRERAGENWVIYRRTPFDVTSLPLVP